MLDYIVKFYQQPDPGPERVEGLATRLLSHPDAGRQWVALDDDSRLIGFAALFFSWNTLTGRRVAILNGFFVVPEQRGHHVGESLFITVLGYVESKGFSSLE